jgi:hypothetical protein
MAGAHGGAKSLTSWPRSERKKKEKRAGVTPYFVCTKDLMTLHQVLLLKGSTTFQWCHP